MEENTMMTQDLETESTEEITAHNAEVLDNDFYEVSDGFDVKSIAVGAGTVAVVGAAIVLVPKAVRFAKKKALDIARKVVYKADHEEYSDYEVYEPDTEVNVEENDPKDKM